MIDDDGSRLSFILSGLIDLECISLFSILLCTILAEVIELLQEIRDK